MSSLTFAMAKQTGNTAKNCNPCFEETLSNSTIGQCGPCYKTVTGDEEDYTGLALASAGLITLVPMFLQDIKNCFYAWKYPKFEPDRLAKLREIKMLSLYLVLRTHSRIGQTDDRAMLVMDYVNATFSTLRDHYSKGSKTSGVLVLREHIEEIINEEIIHA